MPAISAIIPAYNSAAYLASAVASITGQSVPVREIIVIDDGSVDETAALAESLPVRLISQPNAGPSAARNRGIAAATGELIAFLDADDQWTPSKIEDQLRAFEHHPALALVASDMAEIDDHDTVVVESVLEQHDLRAKFQRLDGAPCPNPMAALVEKNFIPTGTVLMRAEALKTVGVFNTKFRFAEDLDLWARIASRFPITCLPTVHMLRRRHSNNATDQQLPMLQGALDVMRSLRHDHRDALVSQGSDPDRLVASLTNDLGYWQFTQQRSDLAAPLFATAWREKPNLRALKYWLLSQLPSSWITAARRLRQTDSRAEVNG
ncbi:MAG: glycosyltransferase [Pseudomonadota bacterium]